MSSKSKDPDVWFGNQTLVEYTCLIKPLQSSIRVKAFSEGGAMREARNQLSRLGFRFTVTDIVPTAKQELYQDPQFLKVVEGLGIPKVRIGTKVKVNKVKGIITGYSPEHWLVILFENGRTRACHPGNHMEFC